MPEQARVVLVRQDLLLKRGSMLIITADDQLYVGTPVVAPPEPVLVTPPPQAELAWSPNEPLVSVPVPVPSNKPVKQRHSIPILLEGDMTPTMMPKVYVDILKQLHSSNNQPLAASDILNNVGGMSPSARLTEMHQKGYLTRFGHARGPFHYVASAKGQEIAAAAMANGHAA